ncbi:hypothetical protein [Rodentibacter haemolyticus]|uniref:Lipoprotein n=1 Tax=Rodentibacter haemolyticus TaxID=2778911 RepID=A0ABX6UVC0_9PAST|nr:hypothetical protein [Rodentibacter haemolyticus]QPB41644.1 hypothetical protein IHV77_06770 [Rodentibacter haemolyticus]
MKKFLMILLSITLVACSSGIDIDELKVKMPKNEQNVIVQIPTASNPVSNAMVIGMVKMSGSPSASNIVKMLAVDNINIGVTGESQILNKATALYALEHVTKVGKNVSIYMMGDSESDKTDLEKVASSKNIKLHYFANMQ